MQIPFSSEVFIPETTLIQESAGEAVILSLATESYYGLDETGTRMWNALTAGPSIQSAYESLLGIYEVDEETLRSDFEAFIAGLVENQLIGISGHE